MNILHEHISLCITLVHIYSNIKLLRKNKYVFFASFRDAHNCIALRTLWTFLSHLLQYFPGGCCFITGPAHPRRLIIETEKKNIQLPINGHSG